MAAWFLVGHRRGETDIGAAEATLLCDLARQVGAAVYAVAVLADLRRARERQVVGREEERRRLQRDLHDGLGPRLTAVAYTIDAARNRLPAETGTAAELLAQSSGEAWPRWPRCDGSSMPWATPSSTPSGWSAPS